MSLKHGGQGCPHMENQTLVPGGGQFCCDGGGVRLVSLIVTGLDVATTGPTVPPILRLALNVSEPSVLASAVGVTVKDPELFVIVTLPLVVFEPGLKSSGSVTLQNKVVPFATFVVSTLKVIGLPSFTEFVTGFTAYVGGFGG